MKLSRSLTLLSLVVLFSTTAEARRRVPHRPTDWTIHSLMVEDTRYPEGSRKREACARELIEIAYDSTTPRRATALLIPGLMQNGHLFDIAPEEGVSYARYLMEVHGIKTYILHIRGIGLSCYPKKSNIDDMAIDDVTTALAELRQMEPNFPLLAFGQSMGGHALQASLGGLDRCGDDTDCFRPETAAARAGLVDGVAILGSNAEFRIRNREVALKVGSHFRLLLRLMPSFLVDRISRGMLSPITSPLEGRIDIIPDILDLVKQPVLEVILWRYFYNFRNVDGDIKKIFKRTSIDSTSRGTLVQFAQAASGGGLRARGGERYSDGLENIRTPLAQATFEDDVFADPEFTRVDNFDRVGSRYKRFAAYENEGHQDFLLNGEFHDHQYDLIEWLMGKASAEFSARRYRRY